MAQAQRIVIKLGTSTLTAGGKAISAPSLVEIARQVAALRGEQAQVVLVSSGAIAAGRAALGYPSLPKHLPAKQMLAAVGQPRLMADYERYFAIYGVPVAQVLLTRADLADRRRFLNARNTFEALLRQGVLPIVNENDTVATEEIRFGDNDNLSAQVANLVEADLLVLLTDQDGLYTADPRIDPEAELIRTIGPEPFSPELWRAAGGTTTGLGTGGMATKLQAADLARHGGTTVVIANGGLPDVLLRPALRTLGVARGEEVGTRLLPVVNKLEGRKRYILSGSRAAAELAVDAGAARALRRGGSLLPAGIVAARGEFERGDAVRVTAPDGTGIAVGLTNYGADDLAHLCGRQSAEIEAILGFTFGDEVIHRNNLVLL
ncbi:MAG TPA: glutamate 5-kinase [Anaerolineaceae bacterium]|nr:glutamate 5-kinase [Anaerolineaceae bacterium]